MALKSAWLVAAFILVPLVATAAPAPASDAAVARLEARIPELMRRAEVPGLSIALIVGGQPRWLHGFGVKARQASSNPGERGNQVDEDTIFSAASLGKPLFAYAVLKLVERGQLGLDVPLTKYLPRRYFDGDARLDQITARIVLSHRTGFPNWRGDGNALAIRFTPGSRFSYSGEGIVYLQRVVQQITGKPLEVVMKELVFAPLGMQSSSYVWQPEYDARAAIGHDADGQPRPLSKPKDAIAAASLSTSARDYARFLSALVDGVGLRPATLRALATPQIAVDPGCTNCTDHAPAQLSTTLFWGLGWGLERGSDSTGSADWLWHWGDNEVFKGFAMISPRTRNGVVFFTNSENGLSLAAELVGLALGGDHPAFDWLKYDRYDSPSARFVRSVRDLGVDRALADGAAALKNGAISEEAVNRVGYRLLRRARTAEAVRLFQLNVSLHPDSGNAHDSLGEAYAAGGQKALAIASYERSLALDPGSGNAVAMLKKLRQ